jgi:leucyl aminopeptidase
MKIELALQPLAEITADAVIVPIFQGETVADPLLAQLDELSNGQLSTLLASGNLPTKKSQLTYLYVAPGKNIARLIIVGGGARAKAQPETFGQLAGAAIRLLVKKKLAQGVFLLRQTGDLSLPDTARLVAESALLAPYEQDIYKNKEEAAFQVANLGIMLASVPADVSAINTALQRAQIVAETTNFVRTLSVEPGNKLPPRELARRAKEYGEPLGLTVESIAEPQLQAMGMGGIVGVGQGSDEPAQLIILRYQGSPDPQAQPIALVGKGITFDSGGLCIKPRDDMWEMKTDMSGAAAVVGALCALAQLRPAINVIGVIGSAENLPSGKSYKPGDVLKTYAGKSIEIIDTDAEGRVVLADALAYANEQNPSCIIDLATLTGACIVALGNLRAGLMSTCDDLAQEVRQASERAGEKLWRLPLHKEYSDMIKSDIADIKNLGGRFAGAITAAAFLQEFVGTTPWVHLDIAGTAWLDRNSPEMAKGSTGYGVRTLVEFVLQRAAQN